MKVTFYGTRGSTPVPEKDYVQFGGNTSCVMLTTDSGHNIIFDAGTGIRTLGSDLKEYQGRVLIYGVWGRLCIYALRIDESLIM